MLNAGKRLLVTGSRYWTDHAIIARGLATALDDLADESGPTVLVHGDCRGADRIAASIWVARFGLPVEPHPADWDGPCRAECARGHRRRHARGGSFCPAAGMYRNIEMVESRIDLCLAFIAGGSSGSSKCARLAEGAGIEVRRFEVAS